MLMMNTKTTYLYFPFYSNSILMTDTILHMILIWCWKQFWGVSWWLRGGGCWPCNCDVDHISPYKNHNTVPCFIYCRLYTVRYQNKEHNTEHKLSLVEFIHQGCSNNRITTKHMRLEIRVISNSFFYFTIPYYILSKYYSVIFLPWNLLAEMIVK